MSRAGTPTDNGAMEAINGWLKEELFMTLILETKRILDKLLMNTFFSSTMLDLLFL